MDNEMFHALTVEQRRCNHDFQEVTSRYDPAMPPNVTCKRCKVRYADYAAIELRRMGHLERIVSRARKTEKVGLSRKAKDDRSEDDAPSAILGTEIEERTLILWNVQRDAMRHIIANGGNVTYRDERTFQYAVLLPVSTQRYGDDMFVLPSGAVLRLTPSSAGTVNGDSLIYAPLHTALHAYTIRTNSEVKHYGPVGRRTQQHRATDEAGSS